MTTMYALTEEDYRCLRENVKELFAAAKAFGGNQLAALPPERGRTCWPKGCSQMHT